jgi:hypothetical protein
MKGALSHPTSLRWSIPAATTHLPHARPLQVGPARSPLLPPEGIAAQGRLLMVDLVAYYWLRRLVFWLFAGVHGAV